MNIYGPVWKTVDLSPQCDGIKKTFDLPEDIYSNTEIVVMDGMVLLRGLDIDKGYFIENQQLTLGDSIPAPNGDGNPNNPATTFWIKYIVA